ncbi:hypothetical protein MKW92_000470 [Papaver armeniacum]|nr:hypothetical protein MKW92_000470 [Papaver armeniacum]
MGNHSPNPNEHRLRLSGSFEDSNNKRRFLRSKSSKEVEKPYLTYTQEKLVLLIIMCGCGTFLTLLHSPTVSHNEQDSRQVSIYHPYLQHF